MAELTENEKFDRLTAEKRHKETVGHLKNISESLSQKSENSDLKDVLSSHLKSVNGLIDKMGAQQKSQPSDMTVKVDHGDVVKSLQQIADQMGDTVSKMNPEKKPTQWTFTHVRNRAGFIDHTIAKAE